jgi:hypothetical protein
MKISKIVAVALVGISLSLSACGILEVPENRRHVEAQDSTNGSLSGIEDTGLTINGVDWIELVGNFDSDTDKDYYRINVLSGVTNVTVHVYHNNAEVKSNFFGINLFPLHIWDGETNYINAASGGSFELSGNVTSLEVRIPATAKDLLGFALPYTSGSYKVHFR